jgi:alanyl-tRNA synthetase
MKAAEIRQSFLNFFQQQGHTIVPSASLMPQSPGLLFTNAGMNQFVPYFLGTDVAPYSPPRATDTQKCIRAGGKHNDLEDVGYDTYHHTMFEMLGNWSFGDYFKKEAILWAWNLVVETWGLPANRLYASVYAPTPKDPGEFDQEAWDIWAELFRSKGLDPAIQIVNGNVKDNFWMMGETGPCGPCSELHVDLTPLGDTKGALVNGTSDQCIEIWNLVFIQYNAEADGTFRELPAKHVDTGMGFERACSIIQGTKGFTDFSRRPSNYNTDVFLPLFATLEKMSGKVYEDIYPADGQAKSTISAAVKTAVAFRVIADHIRTLSFSIADGILPGNNGRNYVLRRILRRAVRYGRQLGFTGDVAFLPELAATLAAEMGDVFPELRARLTVIQETLGREEASFNETLDRGLGLFEKELAKSTSTISGEFAFQLYDTFGFPIDLTQLLCEERNVAIDMPKFEALMEQQREDSRGARVKTVVRALDLATDAVTEFVGHDADETEATILEIHRQDGVTYVITDRTPFYAEMGGQIGDLGRCNGDEIVYVQQIGKARAHVIEGEPSLQAGQVVTLAVDATRRRPIEAHHTATHLLHWALHEVVGMDAVQQGSLVDTERLRFDFSSGPVSAEQVAKIEALVNEKISSADQVSGGEVTHASVKGRADVMQFFGDKYGEMVRVVQVGGSAHQLNGYSMELCGGTHVRNTSEIGLFKIKSEGAIAAGVRRIEASCGSAAEKWIAVQIENYRQEIVKELAKMNPATAVDLSAVLDLSAWKTLSEQIHEQRVEQDKEAKKQAAKAAAIAADAALSELIAAGPASITYATDGDASMLQELLNGLKKRQFSGAAALLVDDGEKLHLGTYCGDAAKSSGKAAGIMLQQLAALGGGKGGGNAEMARGAAPDRSKRLEIETTMNIVVG